MAAGYSAPAASMRRFTPIAGWIWFSAGCRFSSRKWPSREAHGLAHCRRGLSGPVYDVGFPVLVRQVAGRVACCGPTPQCEKLEVYECGEPTIGSSFVQFDLRFYVVALLFIIFDVEVAFFFPWATVFGKATHLMDPEHGEGHRPGRAHAQANALFVEMGVANPTVPPLPIVWRPKPPGLRPAAKDRRRGGGPGPAHSRCFRSSTLPYSSPCCWLASPTCGVAAIWIGSAH